MTWVVGGNCFNGFICVADIQATVEYRGQTQYFNCVQKIHKVHDNLCVAFSGDIRTGLMIIEELTCLLDQNIKENEYFDIDGQSAIVINFLKTTYKNINPTKNPYLELMFLWVAQEGDGLLFRPFCMKFKAPDFHMNSSPQIGAAQTGGGASSESFSSIFSFLSGRAVENESYKTLFGNISEPPQIFTVQKFKKLLFNEASAANVQGVSRSLISFEAVIPHKDFFPDWMAPYLKKAFIEMGIDFFKKDTPNDVLQLVEMDFAKIDAKIAHLQQSEPEKYDAIRDILGTANQLANPQAICQLPPIVRDQRVDPRETIHCPMLFTKWTDMAAFLRGRRISVQACSAIA